MVRLIASAATGKVDFGGDIRTKFRTVGPTRVYVRASPRSGTSYLTRLFKWMRLEARHEAVAADVSVNPFAWEEIDSKVRIHLVRDPRLVIPSLTQFRVELRVRFGQFAGVSAEGMQTLEGAACFWYKWNREIDRWAPHYRFCIENLEKEWETLCGWVGLMDDVPPIPNITGPGVRNEQPNPWKDKQPLAFVSFGRWSERVRMLAKDYGYEV